MRTGYLAKLGKLSATCRVFTAPKTLPEAERTVVAQGHTCARRAGVSRALLDLYESAAIRSGPSWFSENVGITRTKQHEREGAALCAGHREAPCGMGYAVRASIIRDSAWLG